MRIAPMGMKTPKRRSARSKTSGGLADSSCGGTNQESVRKKSADKVVRAPISLSFSGEGLGLHSFEGRRMFRHFFAIHDGFATSRDRVVVVERDRQRVHVGLFGRINSASL